MGNSVRKDLQDVFTQPLHGLADRTEEYVADQLEHNRRYGLLVAKL